MVVVRYGKLSVPPHPETRDEALITTPDKYSQAAEAPRSTHCPHTRDSQLRIQKRFALSPQLFSKTALMVSGDLKSVFPVNNVKIMSPCHLNHKNTLKTSVNLKYAF